MSALARILLQRGYRVTGSSDRRTPLVERLIEEGAHVTIGHAASNLGPAATVVISTAIGAGNPELLAAHAQQREVVHRGALLAYLMNDRLGIAVAGTHGKTTTTAMIAATLEAGGLDPTVIVGGERVDTNTNARDGKGLWLVGEADESDLSFLDLRPEIAVVTNIENDHIVSDAELPGLIAAFERFTGNVRAAGLALIGIDEARAAQLAGRPRAARTRTYGFEAGANVRAVNAAYRGFGSRFEVFADGVRAGEIVLGVPGAINVFDALPAVAIGLELELPFATIASALGGFRGVRRRFEFVARTPRMTVVDDYAHHPTAVAATIAAARAAFDGPIVAAFQPHRYTRTQYLATDFARALRGADKVVLTEVYAASEQPLPGVDARSIGIPLAALGAEVAYVDAIEDLPGYLLEHVPPGALVLALGAGSITGAAAKLARMLEPSGAVAS